MAWNKKGFQAEVRQVALSQTLHTASPDFQPQLATAVQEELSHVFVEARPLYSNIFAALCGEMKTDHKPQILDSEVGCL